MSWRKYFSPVNTQDLSPISGNNSIKPGPAKTNYSSYLPDVYTGSPNRIERYQQYEVMDSDPEVNAALDILAEFCTQKLKDGKTPFTVTWRRAATNSEIRIIGELLQQWCKLQEFDVKIFRIVRNTFKYADCFFIRDPENQKWTYIDPSKVTKIIVNESDGKKPEQYVIKDLAPNFMSLVATQITATINTNQANGSMLSASSYLGQGGQSRGSSGPYPQANSGSRFGLAETEYAIDANHIVHLSLSEGLDNNYPFGTSLLENIFKVYKQKELLEDAILIYRIQRAPERRVFHIDTGNLPPHMAMAFVERVKNEIHQRRIPSQSGGGDNIIDSAYNPMSMNEDYFFPRTSEGRGSSVEPLPGGCFSMDTKVSLLDGRELSIREIADEMEEGKQLWTYSCEPMTGKIVAGLITWAGVTHKSAKVMKITLDNAKEIICTPDHKFPQYDKPYRMTEEFNVGDKLIPLHRTVEDKSFYELYYDNIDKTWKYTHKIISKDLVDDSSDDYILPDATNIPEKYDYVITNIEYLDDEIEVGTLTIDQDEIFHNYHTFALTAGVMVFNSNLGEIEDLKFFTNKLFRGLRIPSSYLPTGAEESQTSYNDGRVGTAYIQEYRFNQYCERLQSLLTEKFNTEFKMFLYSRGVNIDSNLFDLRFNPPLNFASTRQATFDSERINTFNTVQSLPYMSKRFAMQRYLGLTAEEVAENERLWGEENGKAQPTGTDAAGELRSAGLSASGIEGDLGMAGDLSGPEDLESPDEEESGMGEPAMAPPVAPSAPPSMG